MVRIIEDAFWANYETYESLIKRCFVHLFFKKFPNTNSEMYEQRVPTALCQNLSAQESFDNLLVEFKRLRVFERFDREKCNLSAVSEDKKFEQYLYKWAESVLFKEYHDRRKRTLRFRRVSCMDDIHRDTFDVKSKVVEAYANQDDEYIDVDQLPEDQKKATIKYREHADGLYKRFPSLGDIPSMSSEKYETPLDALEEQETFQRIKDLCHTNFERRIVDLKMEGLCNKDIAENLDCSSATVGSTLNKISARYHKRAGNELLAA